MAPRNHVLLLLHRIFIIIAFHFLLVFGQLFLTMRKRTVRISAFSIFKNSFAHVRFVLGVFGAGVMVTVIVIVVILVLIMILML